MSNVLTFKSAEELFVYLETMNQAEQKAMENHHISPEDLRHEDYFVSVRSDLGVVIFGQVIETTEYEEDNESIADSRKRGYIFGMCYSQLCVEGELGSTHVTRINGKISKETFNKAKSHNWYVG